MSVEILEVSAGMAADLAGVKSGDVLIEINGNEIDDVLDYGYYVSEQKIILLIERNSEKCRFNIDKDEYDDIGLEFKSYLMDDKRSCHNDCIFCFISQMPPNMRETLYFKDDDARLSFLQGNYITMTNLKQKDVDRIIKMHLNVNISVHTTNPELRCRMMNNRFAGEALRYLKELSDGEIRMNCQIVLCRGVNDGKELERTLNDLSKLMPNIESIAIVPVGLTKYRDGLYPLEPFDKQSAINTLAMIEKYQTLFLKLYGTRLVFASDEFFLKAEMEIPKAEEYEDYPQYENGVGMIRTMIDDMIYVIEDTEYVANERNVALITGVLATDTMKNIARKIEEKWENVNCDIITINNDFFGENITVAGLITGTDIIHQLKTHGCKFTNGGYEELLISAAMLMSGTDIFLDDVTVKDVERELSAKVRVVGRGAQELLNDILGRND